MSEDKAIIIKAAKREAYLEILHFIEKNGYVLNPIYDLNKPEPENSLTVLLKKNILETLKK